MNITINCSRNTITNNEIDLGSLLAHIGLVEKARKTPTPKKLRETAGTPIATVENCIVYGNGYAVYENDSGRTVMWLPDCVSFTYYFNKVSEAEKGFITETDKLPEGFLEELPWFMAVTLIGDHRIEVNCMNRTGGRIGTKDFDSEDRGDKDGNTEMAREEKDAYRQEYTWCEYRFGESPEAIVIRQESRKEMLKILTDKQREVFVLYFRDGLRQQEISELLGISRDSVSDRLKGALKKIKRFF